MTRNHFKPAEEHSNRFPVSTIALVATVVCTSLASSHEILTNVQVCAALDEWRTGQRIAVLFSSNIYTDVYNNHMILLKSIKERNLKAYLHLLCELYINAS